MTSNIIPVVDITAIAANVSAPSGKDYQDVGRAIHSAFSEIGFVFVTNHGVPSATVRDLFASSKRFFELGRDAKEACPMTMMGGKACQVQGYVSPGSEMLDNLKEDPAGGERAVHELREAFDVSSVDPAAPFPDDTVPELRAAVTEVLQPLQSLADHLFRAIGVALGVEEDFFVNEHRGLWNGTGINMMRTLYYPPIEGKVAAGTTRCGEHSDYGSLTFLFQDDLGGLEVRDKRGSWVRAKPVKDSMLVNVGDLLEVYTNGVYPATRHRVVIPEEELVRKQPRQSFVLFLQPDAERVARPIRGEEPRKREYGSGVTSEQHVLNQYAATYKT